MVENYSFFNESISGIANFGDALKSIITNWFVFNSDIYIKYFEDLPESVIV